MPGALGLSEATDITVSTLGAFKADPSEAAHYSNVLAQTANAANLSVEDLGMSLKYAAAPAKSFGSTV